MAVDTEDLINSAIDARAARDAQRAQIAQRREQIARQLSGVSGGRRNRGQIASLQAELANLGAAERNLHHQDTVDQANVALRANTAFRNAHLAASEAKLNRDADVATAAANLQNGLARLQAKYPNRILDSNQAAAFHRELSDLRDANPLGLRNESTAAMLRQASEFHDQERNKAISKASVKMAGYGLNPNDFANRDTSKDFITSAKTLADAMLPAEGGKQGTKFGAESGDNAVFEVGDKRYLVPRNDFLNWKGLMVQQPIGQVAPISQQDTNSGIQPIVPTYGGQGAAPPGALVRNPDGSISPIVPTYGGEGAAPPGVLVRTGVAQIGTPTPTGVPQDQQIIGNTERGSPVASQPSGLVQPYQLEPTSNISTVGPTTTATQPDATPALATAPQVQTVRVTHPDGRTGTIPASQLEDALKNGYQQVQ